jgi:hypothetical protein
MAQLADYKPIRDAPFQIGAFDVEKDFSFEIPKNIHVGSRSIMMFMIKKDSEETTKLSLNINGKFSKQEYFLQERGTKAIHEIIERNVLKVGENVVSFRKPGSPPEPGSAPITISDVVIFFQGSN